MAEKWEQRCCLPDSQFTSWASAFAKRRPTQSKDPDQDCSTQEMSRHSHDAVAVRGGFPEAAQGTASGTGGPSTSELLRKAKQFFRSGRKSVHRYELVDHGFISNIKPTVDDGKGLAHLLLVNAKRRISEEGVPAHEGVQALLAEEASERSHLLRRSVERSEGLARLAAANEFDDAEQSDRAHRAHRRMLGLQLRSQFLQHHAHFFRVIDQPIFFLHTSRSQRRGAFYGITVISKSSVEHFVLKVLRDAMPHAHSPQRQVTGGQSPRHAQEIGYNLPVIPSEPRAGSSETRHHFIGNHHDSILVAKLAHTFKISVGRNKNPIRSSNRLQNEGSDRVRTFKLSRLFNHRQRRFSRFPSALDAVIRIQHMNHARNARLRGPSPRIAGKAHRSSGRAVIRALARHDLVASSKEAGNLDGILVRLGAAIGKEEGVDVARRNFGELRPQPRTNFRSHERIRIRKRRGLLADGLNDALVAVSDVDRHQLAGEVNEAGS